MKYYKSRLHCGLRTIFFSCFCGLCRFYICCFCRIIVHQCYFFTVIFLSPAWYYVCDVTAKYLHLCWYFAASQIRADICCTNTFFNGLKVWSTFYLKKEFFCRKIKHSGLGSWIMTKNIFWVLTFKIKFTVLKMVLDL